MHWPSFLSWGWPKSATQIVAFRSQSAGLRCINPWSLGIRLLSKVEFQIAPRSPFLYAPTNRRGIIKSMDTDACYQVVIVTNGVREVRSTLIRATAEAVQRELKRLLPNSQ